MSHLSERAKAVQIWLEGDWTRHYRRQGDRHWRSEPLISNLKRKGICATERDGWEALRELAGAGVIETTAPISAQQHLDVQLRLSEALRHRLESEFTDLDDSLGLDAVQAAVWRHALDGVLEDWSLTDQQRLAAGLRELAEALPEAYALGAFAASARYLLGSSNLLGSLPRELVRAFGIDVSAFRDPVAWVLAAMPDEPEGLLLIENIQSFEQACRVGLDRRLALICSFGYGLALSEALKVPERVHLVGEGAASRSLVELLELPNRTFWGALDPEGLRTFLNLRQAVPELRLSALYAPMIETFEKCGGHPLHQLTGKGEQRPAGEWQRGLDQEWLDDISLTALAGQSLDPATQQSWLDYLSAQAPTG